MASLIHQNFKQGVVYM